uniref:MULE domain-containing protein n=1 Tax=Heterorhabditis bacteriophora TaxID=37862 RepID=A0A1I7XPS1_HETBA
MEPQRVRIGTLLIGQRALELNFRSLSASLIEIYLYLIPPKRDTCFKLSYLNKSKAGVIETYICIGCRSLKDKNRQGNYGVVPTVHVLNSAFIDNPKNARRVHYCQPKSAARLLICREVIAEYNIFRRKTSCETTGHIRRNIMASISKPDYDDFEPAEKRVLMETLAVEYGAGLDTLRRTIQRNRVKSIPSLVMGNIIPEEVQGTGSSQLYTVIVEANGGYWLPIFFVFIRDAKRTTHENVFGFLGKLIKPLRGQAPLIPHDVKLITDFEIQAIDAIKSTLGVEVLGYEIKCHFHYAQCINCRANALHFGKVLKESATVGIFFRRLQMLPFMPPHLVRLSSVLEPPRIPVVDVQIEQALDEFMAYHRAI